MTIKLLSLIKIQWKYLVPWLPKGESHINDPQHEIQDFTFLFVPELLPFDF